MTLREYLQDVVLGLTGGLSEGGSPADISRLTFISDQEQIRETHLREYDIWYKGVDDELQNFYNKNNTIDFSYEPWYWQTKRSYYWTVVSTETDVKRTHSGMPQDMVNTMVGIVGTPRYDIYKDAGARAGARKQFEKTGEGEDSPETKTMQDILNPIGFWTTVREVQEPMTLVEGWGCWKTEWDLSVSDEPTVRYYRAEDVDFVWKGGMVSAVIFKDWYQGKDIGERYLTTEIRTIVPRRDRDGRIHRDLRILCKSWKVGGGDDAAQTSIVPVRSSDIPERAGADDSLVITDMDSLLAQPCIFYRDSTEPSLPGKSIFQNKISLFDDLDQAYSQMANVIGKSTPEELFNTDFLEIDPKTHFPIQPKRYDRKYTTFHGARDSNGGVNTNVPVQVTQPNLNITMYQQAITQIESQILSGYMSPATMGISVSVQATAQSQREKEKVTVFTRQHIIDCETAILQGVMNDLLMAHEYLSSPEHRITTKKYDISIKYEPFATASYEERAASLYQILGAGAISPEMYVEKLYGSSLSEKERKSELEYIRSKVDQQSPAGAMDAQMDGQSQMQIDPATGQPVPVQPEMSQGVPDGSVPVNGPEGTENPYLNGQVPMK